MRTLAAGRLFADHYQFQVHDAEANPYAEDPGWTEHRARLGYAHTATSVHVGTVAHLNDHWVTVHTADTPPPFRPHQRVVALNVSFPSGRGVVASLGEPVLEFEVEPGPYVLYVVASNPGVDLMSLDEEGELTDAEIEARTDLERYDLVLVPGHGTPEGVVHGPEHLW